MNSPGSVVQISGLPGEYQILWATNAIAFVTGISSVCPQTGWKTIGAKVVAIDKSFFISPERIVGWTAIPVLSSSQPKKHDPEPVDQTLVTISSRWRYPQSQNPQKSWIVKVEAIEDGIVELKHQDGTILYAFLNEFGVLYQRC
ncbi:MAG: hypothetical protein AAFO04_27670 [Cyanobacteria bacterium J06592_8]